MSTAQKLINQKLNEISTSEKEIPKKLLKKANSSKSIESIRNYKFKNVFSFDKISQKTKKEINSNSKAEKILYSDKEESRSLSQKKENILDMPDLIQKHQTKKKKENLKLKTIFKIIKDKKRIKIQLILWIFLSPPKKKLAIILLFIIL